MNSRTMQEPRTIAVVGLGYVGLPLAVALARHYPVVGYDVDAQRIAALKCGHDRTREVPAAALKSTTARLTESAAAIRGAELFIITVPTPVDTANRPDLTAVREACETVGRALSREA